MLAECAYAILFRPAVRPRVSGVLSRAAAKPEKMDASMVVDATDGALVERARAGDRAAFETLVLRYADRLHSVVRRLVESDHDAQEVTQEAFLRAWRGLDGFKGEAQFFTWLYRIGVNEANRRLQRNASAAAAQSLDAGADDVRDPAPSPAARAEHHDLRAALEDAMAALHPDYRTALVLRDVEGLTTSQAAEVMELTEAAFKSRLHRARLAVRDAVVTYL